MIGNSNFKLRILKISCGFMQTWRVQSGFDDEWQLQQHLPTTRHGRPSCLQTNPDWFAYIAALKFRVVGWRRKQRDSDVDAARASRPSVVGSRASRDWRAPGRVTRNAPSEMHVLDDQCQNVRSWRWTNRQHFKKCWLLPRLICTPHSKSTPVVHHFCWAG
jgi:hypothetical protein